MRPRRVLRRRYIALVALAAALATPSATGAAPLRAAGRATVKSVDGPGQLTIQSGRRTLRVRLYFVDLPQVGECGAAETTAALRGFVKRAPRPLRYELVETYTGERRRFARDPDGRYPAAITYRSQARELGGDLIAASWARPGMPPAKAQGFEATDGIISGEDLPGRRVDDAAPRPRRGIWARCGGRLHLPLGQPIPSTAPAPWAVDDYGIANSVGPMTLSPTLTPEIALTVPGLAAFGPVEATRWGSGCRLWLPSLQIRAWSYGEDNSCRAGYVSSVRTAGPDPAPITRGGAVGDAASTFRQRFPRAALAKPGELWPLSGSDHPQWAWQTEALVDGELHIAGLATFASPASPGA